MTFKFLKIVVTTCRYAMCISIGVLSVSGTASATLIDSIAALDEGAMYRVLFVTSTKTDATSSDIEYYNTLVSTAADNGSVTGSLGLSWEALASTLSVNAQDNTGIRKSDSAPVTLFNTLGGIIATSGEDLWDGTLAAPISYDESGAISPSVGFRVWTGTISNGSSAQGQQLGSDSPIFGIVGETTNGYATTVGSVSNIQSYIVYGASMMAEKPSSDVPEPGTVILLSLGLAGLSFARYRRQS
jgi:hypothetical protein